MMNDGRIAPGMTFVAGGATNEHRFWNCLEVDHYLAGDREIDGAKT